MIRACARDEGVSALLSVGTSRPPVVVARPHGCQGGLWAEGPTAHLATLLRACYLPRSLLLVQGSYSCLFQDALLMPLVPQGSAELLGCCWDWILNIQVS